MGYFVDRGQAGLARIAHFFWWTTGYGMRRACSAGQQRRLDYEAVSVCPARPVSKHATLVSFNTWQLGSELPILPSANRNCAAADVCKSAADEQALSCR